MAIIKSTHNVKLLCSYGGNLQPHPLDQRLWYVGGDNKLVSVDRRIKLADLLAKLEALFGFATDGVRIKFQLPGQDLNDLINLTDDDDLEYMMTEYDYYLRSKVSPVRFRLFLSSITKIDAVSGSADYLSGSFDSITCINSGKVFDLESWTIPKAEEVTGNTCAAAGSKKLESRDQSNTQDGQCFPGPQVARVYNVPVTMQNGGEFQSGRHYYGGGIQPSSNYSVERMVAVGGVNGYSGKPVYVMVADPKSVELTPEQRRIHDGGYW